jgi:hypothetical protein
VKGKTPRIRSEYQVVGMYSYIGGLNMCIYNVEQVGNHRVKRHLNDEIEICGHL